MNWTPEDEGEGAPSGEGEGGGEGEDKTGDDKVADADKVFPDQGKAEDKTEPKDDEGEGKDDAAPEPITAENLTLPEGFEVNEEAMGKFIDLVNNTEMTPQERAQSLIDLQSEVMAEVSNTINQAFEDTQTEWREAIQADPDFGGDKLEANLGEAAKVIDKFGSDKFREMLEITGAGNHPEMMRFIMNVAKVANEGGVVPGGTPPPSERTAAETLYPNMGKP